MHTLKNTLGSLIFISLLVSGATSCSEQTPQKTESISYSPIGPLLDKNYRVTGLYLSNGNAYLPIAGRADGPLRYAQISTAERPASTYRIVDLLIPTDTNYKVVGTIFADGTSDRLYAPVVATDRTSNVYTWLSYDTKSLTPVGPPLGNYSVPANPELQFAVRPPGFYKKTIYANYAGNLIGIDTSNGQQVFQKSGLLTPAQTTFSILENKILTFSIDGDNMILIDMNTGDKKLIGESLSDLSGKGYKPTPFFVVSDGLVQLLALGTESKPAICVINLQSAQQWQCKASDAPLPAGAQIIGFNADMGSGTLYFLTNSIMTGTQLYKIKQS